VAPIQSEQVPGGEKDTCQDRITSCRTNKTPLAPAPVESVRHRNKREDGEGAAGKRRECVDRKADAFLDPRKKSHRRPPAARRLASTPVVKRSARQKGTKIEPLQERVVSGNIKHTRGRAKWSPIDWRLPSCGHRWLQVERPETTRTSRAGLDSKITLKPQLAAVEGWR